MIQAAANLETPADPSLFDALAPDLLKLVQENLAPDEAVEIQLKGLFQEVLVCTGQRVMILKTGIMTGHTFSTNVFAFPYCGVTAAEVQFGFVDGYFELIAGGVPHDGMSLWAKDPTADPSQAPNCVAFVGRQRAERFQRACALILDRAGHP